MRRAEDRMGHAHGKFEVLPDSQSSVQREKHAAGGDVPRQSRNVAISRGQHHRQGKGKSHRTTHLLPATRCGLRTERKPRFCFLNSHSQSPIHMSLVATVAVFVHLAQGTKVSGLVTGRAPVYFAPIPRLHMILCVSVPMAACGSGLTAQPFFDCTRSCAFRFR